MIAKLKSLIAEYREIISYIFFGGLTTLVSWGSYFVFKAILNVNDDVQNLNYLIAQGISWVLAVAFAYVVNKLFVFEDKEKTTSGIFRQIWQFVSSRIASGLIETLLLWISVSLLLFDENISKIAVSVVTVVLNYFASKFLVFGKGER